MKIICVQQHDFEVSDCYRALTDNNHDDGAVVTFVGRVRDFNQAHNVSELFLEHYPGMTEKTLDIILQSAINRWDLNRGMIVHRVGQLQLGEQIVFVGVTAPHRKDAFNACEWIMNELKSSAPFWKREATEKGTRWLINS